MSDGLKIGLAVGGLAVVGYLLFRSSSIPSVTGAGVVPTPFASPLAPAPGSITPASVASSAGSAVGKYGATFIATAALGPIGLLTTSTGRTILSTGASAVGGALSGAGSAVKSGVSAIGSAASSIGHSIVSIF